MRLTVFIYFFTSLVQQFYFLFSITDAVNACSGTDIQMRDCATFCWRACGDFSLALPGFLIWMMPSLADLWSCPTPTLHLVGLSHSLSLLSFHCPKQSTFTNGDLQHGFIPANCWEGWLCIALCHHGMPQLSI